MLGWSFQPLLDLRCSSSFSPSFSSFSFTFPSSVSFASSFVLAYPKYAELIVGGISFGPLTIDENRIHAPLLSQPFDNCLTSGSVSGTFSSNAPSSFNITTGEPNTEGEVRWSLLLNLQYRNGSTSELIVESTGALREFASPRTSMKNVAGTTDKVSVMFDQPVLMKTADMFQVSEGGSVRSFHRLSALVYNLEFNIPPNLQSISVVLPPLDGPFGPATLLGKTILYSLPPVSVNPPLLLSEDLGYFNQDQTAVLVVTGSLVGGSLTSSCFSFSTQGPAVGTVKILDSPAAGSYRVSVPAQGEGSFTLTLDAGCLSISDVPSLAASITLTRDITPPTLQLVSSVISNQTRNTSFDLSLVASEPVYLDGHALDLRTITGGGTMSRIRSESSSSFSASVTDIAVDLDGIAMLNVGLLPGSISDRAGNAGPSDKIQIMVRVLGNATRRDAYYFPPRSSGGGDSALQWVLIALAVLVAGLLLVYFVTKRRQKRIWAPADPEEEFENYGMRIFEQYAGAEQEYMTFDDIVRHSQYRGYPIAEAERGAKVLLRAAGSGDRISRDEWMRWLRRKVTRGQTPNVNHLRELRAVFPLTT